MDFEFSFWMPRPPASGEPMLQYYKAIWRSKALCYDPLMLGWVGVSMLQQEFPVLYWRLRIPGNVFYMDHSLRKNT